MNMDLDHLSKNLVDSALTFTRIGLSVAGSAVGYAAEVLKDVEHELRHASERFKAPVEDCGCGCADTATPPTTDTDTQ
ncbi:MAG TPA: hypothetical protein VGQ83_26600 [Polyangia bacterium]|jgi:hypothetical protein